MAINIRKPCLEPLINGVPRDFAQVKDYFNRALQRGTLPWVPRKTPITDDEINKLWIPSLETNINLVAESLREVVGQVTVFYDTKSTAYEHSAQRFPGNIGLTAKPSIYQMVVKPLMIGLVKELKTQERKAVLNLAKESPGNSVMERLGYTPRLLKNQERYQQVGLSGVVYQYELPG